MRILMYLMLIISSLSLTSCYSSVEPGERGVYVNWGGEPDMTQVYEEGLHSTGMGRLETFDVREKTLVQRFVFNDSKNMETGVEIALDYNLNPNQVHYLYTRITDVETKILKNLKSAAKEVVPQYTASDLNLRHRQEAETALTNILSTELPEFYVNFARVQITDVDIPKKIAEMAEKAAVQTEQNLLAAKMEEEAVNKAKAQVATAKGNYEAAKYEAERKEILSDPKLLKLKELELQGKMIEVMGKFANKGISPYGHHNVFEKIPMIGTVPQ